MAEFATPDFLLHHSEEEIHERMKEILPPDLDLSEGGHAYNMTRPTAMAIAELCEFILPEVVQLIFPESSYGEFLDAHARSRNLSRRPAVAATGEITITGAAGIFIPEGSLFSTVSINDEPSVDYQTTEFSEMPSSGTITVPVECTQPGIIGNTNAGTIVLVSSKLDGITSVTNEEDVTGGAEEETDESLSERVLEYDKSLGDSFTGSTSDYKRWAKSVAGVGEATVVAATDDSGMVTIILTDINGVAATENLCTQVYNHIMRPDNPEERLAPINALLTVSAPETIAIGVKATVELAEGSSVDEVKEAFLEQIAAYLPTAMDDGEVKYTKVAATLSAIEGVNDFKDLQIAEVTAGGTTYGTSNIQIAANKLPTVDEDDCTITSGTV